MGHASAKDGTGITDTLDHPDSDLAAMAHDAGIRRIHVLAWRELADAEAGGSEIYVARVAAIWAAAGLDVTVRTSFAQGHPAEARRDGYRVVRKGGRYTVFPGSIAAGVRGSYGPRDALLEVWNGVPYVSPVWANCANTVLVHHVHRDMWELVLKQRLARVGKFIEARVAPPFYRNTRFTTPSRSSRDEVIAYYGARPENVTIASPGVDPHYQPSAEKSPHPLIVGCGRLMPPKRFDELIRIAAELRRSHDDLELVIVGDGYELPRLNDLIRSLDASSWIRLAGYVSEDEKLALFQRAWAVSSASVAEGWGMTLTEAAACGTPAVATRITGHLDSVAHDKSGLLASSPREMVRQLSSLITDDELRRRLSEGAQKHAAEFTWETCAYRTMASLADDARRRVKAGRPSRR